MRFLLVLFLLISFRAYAQISAVRPPLAKPYVMAPIKVDEISQGEVWIFPREQRKDFALESQATVEILTPFLPYELLQRLKMRITDSGTVSLQDLDALGLKTTFSEADLELHIQIPLTLRKRYRLNFNFGRPDVEMALKPQSHSGYLNFRMNKSFEYGPAPLAGRLDLAENINGFVFETTADYLEQDTYPWKRQDTRIRKDDEERMLRYTLGDLTVPSRGFQVSPALGGVGVSREFSIQPYRTARPLGNQELQIKRPSLVELYINGSLYSQIRLQPGNFNIRDFPLAVGQNNVKIKVRDDLGQEETFDFSLLFENTILTQGLHEFSYNVGLPWKSSQGDRAYNQHNNIVSLFHRYGFNDQFTGGVNIQNYLNQNLGGLEVSKINTWGYTSGDVAVSDNQQRHGAAGRLRYRSLDRMFGQEVRTFLTLEFEKRDPDFLPVVVDNPGLSFLDSRYDLQLTHRFERNIMVGVGGGYQKAYGGTDDNRIYRANFIFPFNAWTRLELSYNKNVGGPESEQGFVSFYWSEREGLRSASAYYDTNNKSTNLTFAKSNQRNYDDYRLWGTLQNLEGQTNANLSGEYLTQAGTLRLDQYSRNQNNESHSVTTLGVSSGIAWAGSEWAFTQPINDSFTLISVPNMPKDKELIVNPDGSKGEGVIGNRKVATLPNQTSYYVYQINLDSTSLPLGYLLEKEYFSVKPSYRSGVLISASLTKKVMVKGRLLEQGKALAFAAGDIYDAQNRLVDNTFFTNKDGKFFVEGLELGRYKLILDQVGMRALYFEVGATAQDAAVLDLGEVSVQRGDE